MTCRIRHGRLTNPEIACAFLALCKTCDPQSGPLFKFNIGRSCAHACEVQMEEEEVVAETSAEGLRETKEHRAKEGFTASEREIEEEVKKDSHQNESRG